MKTPLLISAALCFFGLFLVCCSSSRHTLSDRDGTNTANRLYQSLKSKQGKSIRIGYEDALAYGVNWWAEPEMCDMYRSSGVYPAIYGWDIGNIHENENLDSVSFSDMVNWIKDVHLSGGINTISWHMMNPVNGMSSWDKGEYVNQMLPGGEFHSELIKKLDVAAVVLKNCRIGNEYIPIIFRPFHEHNGDWFWWGKGNVSEEDYIELFRFVVDYFRNEKDIHHLIYAFSPDRSRITDPTDKTEYLYGYPGDEYVDILGLDNYHDVLTTSVDSIDSISNIRFTQMLETLTDLAREKDKLAAVTETGLEGIKDPVWFTSRILAPIRASQKAQRISYIMFWRNADVNHHYMVYPEHPAVEDFINFIKDPLIQTGNRIDNRRSSASSRLSWSGKK